MIRPHRKSPGRSAVLGALLFLVGLAAFPAASLAQASVPAFLAGPDPVAVPAADPTPDDKKRAAEYRVKAALIFKFAMYSEWPKEAFKDEKAPFVVETIGENPFGELLKDAFADKKLAGRAVVVRYSAKVPEKIDAHVVFAGDMSSAARALLLERCQDCPIMVIGDTPGFAADGAVINLYLEQGKKVRFEINPDAAKAAELKISSQLLKLAKIVKTKKKKEEGKGFDIPVSDPGQEEGDRPFACPPPTPPLSERSRERDSDSLLPEGSSRSPFAP